MYDNRDDDDRDLGRGSSRQDVLRSSFKETRLLARTCRPPDRRRKGRIGAVEGSGSPVRKYPIVGGGGGLSQRGAERGRGRKGAPGREKETYFSPTDRRSCARSAHTCSSNLVAAQPDIS